MPDQTTPVDERAVGRCGAAAPTLYPHTTPEVCALPAGHPGWHRADGGCEWGPAATADALTEARVENRQLCERLDRARDAVRDGDWDGLWRAVGISPDTPLPEMRTALDTAMPVPAGWFDTAAELAAETGLTAEQEIRVEALHAAATISTSAGYDSGEVLDIAERFESYIRGGDV